jgi:hypothetical protein
MRLGRTEWLIRKKLEKRRVERTVGFMNSRCIGLLIASIFWAWLCVPAALASAPNYTGHYETPASKTDWSFSLDVTQTGSKATITFSAGMADGSGAAPDGDGGGKLDAKGALQFTFKDSFDNEGTGTLVAGKNGYQLTMNVTKGVEPRALVFYQEIILIKKSDKPASP